MKEQSPKSVVFHFQHAWNKHNADELANVFVDDAHFINVTGLWWSDKDQIRKAHQFGFENIFGDSHMTIGRTEVRMLGSDHAVVHARVTVSGQNTPDGQIADDRRTVFTFVVTRMKENQGAQWKAVSAQNTDVVPGGPETHVNSPQGQTAVRYRT
ncbi:MAG TPA: SgcJ/EcaC family oxidoreductase [Candidatus Yaniella excrementigallinarum]|nr:SgcJ/EcaC family oxidoreductase [Candidatus Yaniella excrementigallinarum]